MLSWMAVKGFLTAQWKWLVIGALLLIALYGWYKVNNVIEERNALKQELDSKITQLVKDKTELSIAKQEAEQTINMMLADKARIEELYNATLKVQETINTVALQQEKIFEEHDFTKLSNAKPGLIIKPMNRATQERFDEIVTVFND